MASTIIGRLKKTGQQIAVRDIQGNTTNGTVSGWDDVFLVIRLENGDEILFPMENLVSVVVPGGYERAHPLREE